MKDDTTNAFGKLKRDGDGRLTAWHPLIDHLTDVAACFEGLCGCRSVRRALERTASRPLDERDIARLAVLVFLHDLGKANSGFQAKRWAPGTAPREWPASAGHGKEAIVLFTEELAHLLPGDLIDAMDAWGDAVFSLLAASFGHHGRPIDPNQPSWNRAVWRPVTDPARTLVYDPAAVLRNIGEQAQALYPDAFGPDGTPLPDAPAFGHLFAGLVQLADWLGSDTDFFPYAEPGERRGETAPAYAADAVTALGLDAAPWQQHLADAAPSFKQVFDYPPYPAQSATGAGDLGALVVLESETGSGKTEAALWRFVQLFRRGEVDGLYFALPTRVAATQLYERVRAAIERLWPDAAPLVVRALPGYAAADGHQPQALPDFRVLWSDKAEDQKAHRRWAAETPKRFLAAPLAVGTIDQALFGALQVRHAHLRHALLARSLLVVDEVHASDAYMTALLEHLLCAHLRCGGQALLLSATLGASARDRYLTLARGEAPHLTEPTPFDTACQAPYPCLSDRGGIRPLTSKAQTKPLDWSTQDAMDDPERIATMALEAAATGAKVLIVRNTVPAAVALLRALEARCPNRSWLFDLNGVVCLHHSRFSRQDRPLLDARVEARIGKDRPPGPLILVGTQTLEQSLDLDADLLITDLCPMDVLLQRIGRLHRHQRPAEQRPPSYREARAIVLTPTGHDLTPLLDAPGHGLGRFKQGGGVYPDLRILEATRRLIDAEPRVEIPRHNRRLVETATHVDRLETIAAELGEPWRRLGEAIVGDTGAERIVAKLHALEIDKAFEEQQGFPTDLDIATRLGVRDRLLLFDPAPTGPFGAPLRQLPMRHYLAPKDLDPDAQPQQVEQCEGAVEFTLGTTRYRYGRFGLERLDED